MNQATDGVRSVLNNTIDLLYGGYIQPNNISIERLTLAYYQIDIASNIIKDYINQLINAKIASNTANAQIPGRVNTQIPASPRGINQIPNGINNSQIPNGFNNSQIPNGFSQPTNNLDRSNSQIIYPQTRI